METTMDCPSCYGKYPCGDAPCAKCEYFDSCRYYTATARKVESRSHLVSYEAIAPLIPEGIDDTHTPGCEETEAEHPDMIPALSGFFRYLLELDDYTLGIISEVVSPSSSGRCTVSKLSRLHGCSRQAMHRKLMSIIALHPELSTLFQNILYKLSSSRRVFLRRRAAEA